MERSTERRRPAALLVLLVMGLVMLAPAAAWADGPVVVKESLELTVDQGDPGDLDCDGDGINDYSLHLEGRLVAKFWPDGRTQLHFTWEGLGWVDGGDSVRFHHALTETVYPDGTVTITGLPFGMFGDPGGPLVKDAGLLRFEPGSPPFMAGPHELAEDFGLDASAATCLNLGL